MTTSETDVPVLEASGLSVGYNDVAVVHDVDLKVGRGELVALLGPNGAGKTTTLLALAGVLRALGGVVLWLGNPTTEPLYKRARQGLGLLTDDRGVLRSLSGGDNLRLAGVSDSSAIALFPELSAKLTLRVGDLSGGEQQMLAVAKSLGRQPALLLADEISLGLAPLIVKRIFNVIRAAVENDRVAVRYKPCRFAADPRLLFTGRKYPGVIGIQQGLGLA